MQRKFREFLGLINFYHWFLNHGASILKPLHNLLAAPLKRKKELVWTDAALKAFTAAKKALSSTTLLSYPVMNAPTSVMTDASNVEVGAVLQQFVQDKWCPITYFPGHSNRPRHNLVALIGNYWQYILPSNTFGTSLRAVNSPSLQIISP